MKAVVYETYGGPEVLTVAHVEKPIVGEDDVLVKVGASGINPVDTYFRAGIREVPSFPHIPHFDLAGTVVEAGKNVTNVSVGDRVWGTNISGTAAEYVACPQSKVFPLADHLTFEEGAALAMAFMTAHLSLFARGQLQKEDTVLIYGGAGAVGHAAIQLAKQTGAFVITTAGDETKAQVAKEAGADEVILYKQTNVTDAIESLKATVTLILDVSVSENLESNLDFIENGGRIVTVGSPKNNTPSLPWRKLNMKNVSLHGVLLFTAKPSELKEAGTAISTLFQQKKLTAHLAKAFSFTEATKAHEALEQKIYNGTIVLTP